MVALDGPTGQRLWSRRLGSIPEQVWPSEGGRVVAVCRTGEVFVLDDAGALLGRQDLAVEVTALVRPGDHRRAGVPLVVGLADGRTLLLAPGALAEGVVSW